MTSETLRLGFAFSLGTATFFAPCALPLLPGYIAFFIGQTDTDNQSIPRQLLHAGFVSTMASLGFLVVFGILAVVVFVLGSNALRDIAVLELIVGIVLLGVGAILASGKHSVLSIQTQLPKRRRGPIGYLLFGIGYAAAAAGCTAPLFIGVASVGLATPKIAVPLFAAYTGGMVTLLIGVTVLTTLGQDAIVSQLTTKSAWITRGAGIVLFVAGTVQVYYFVFVFDGLAGIA